MFLTSPIKIEPLLAIAFASPWMLAFGLLVTVPIAIHFWNRRRATRHRWAASQFLEQAIHDSSRRIRIERTILLAIRCSVIAAIAFALAEPIRSSSVPTDQSEHIIFVLDISLSMQAKTELGSRLAVAKQRIRNVIDQAPIGTRFSLLTMGFTNETLVWNQATAMACLDALSTQTAEEGCADAKSLLRVLMQQFANDSIEKRLKTRIVIASDFCANTWSGIASLRQTPISNAVVETIDVGKETIDNLAIVAANLPNGYAIVDRQAELVVTIRNFSESDISTSVSFSAESQPLNTIDVHIPAKQSVRAALPMIFRQEKDYSVDLTIDDDSLADDDEYHVVVPVRRQIRILCVESSWKSSDYVSTALAAADDSIKITRVSAVNLPRLLGYDGIVLCDATAMAEIDYRRLNEFVSRGGVLIASTGQATRLMRENSTNISDWRLRIGEEVQVGEYRFDSSRLNHDAVSLFRPSTDLADIAIWRYRKLQVNDDTDTILYFSNADPAIMVFDQDLGRVVLFATSLASANDDAGGEDSYQWNTLPLLPSFLPLMHRNWAFSQHVAFETKNLTIGQSIRGPNRLPANEQSVSVKLADSDEPETLVSVERAQPIWSSPPIRRAGQYRATQGLEDNQMYAVNRDPRESDLTRADFQTLPKWLSGSKTNNESAVKSMRSTSAEWNTLALSLVAALLLCESAFAAWSAAR